MVNITIWSCPGVQIQPQNVLDLISFFPWTKSEVVSWWRTLGILVLGLQSTSLVLHAFHVSLTLFLIHVCIFKNNNEHTLWCNINSSNVSNTIIVKDCFTCESKVVIWLYPCMWCPHHSPLLGYKSSSTCSNGIQKCLLWCWNTERWLCCMATTSNAPFLLDYPVAYGKN